jgi:hypothetical protein
MPIDLGNAPTGTPPTAEEKTQILSALGIPDVSTRSGAENLSNKTLVSPAFSGTATGQLDLPTQTTTGNFSVLTRNTLRRELLSQGNNIQRFNTYRTLSSRGGLNAANISRSGTTFIDNDDVASLGMSSSTFNHTSWAEHSFGVCYTSFSSGGSVAFSNSFSFALKINGVQVNSSSLGVYYAGVSGSSQGGVPTGRGFGLFMSRDGYRLWAHSGTSYSATGSASTDTITAAGHNFIDDDIVRFSSLTGGSGLSTGSCYYVINVSGDTFQLSNTIGGPVLDFTTNITAATIPQLPTYSSVLSGLPSISGGFQSNSNFLFVSNGAGTGSVFYGGFNSPVDAVPLGTIAIPSSGTNTVNMRLSVTATGSYSNISTNAAVVTASFAPFAV